MSEMLFEPGGIMAPQIFGLPVDRGIMFSNHKQVYKKRIEKRQRKLIVKLSFLKPFLKQGEKILLVTTGYSPIGNLAHYVTGFLFVYLKRSLFVFTNYRIFHIPTKSDYQYKHSIAQISYADCQSISLKGGTLTVQYVKFRRLEKFNSVALPERKKIRALFKKLPLSGTQGQLGERSHLCPQCTHRLSTGKYICENCQLKFKNKLAAFIFAILLPGGGYFYTRHFLIGLITAVLEMFLISYIAVVLNNTLKHIQGSFVYLLVLSGVYLALKAIFIIHSSHFIQEFIPMQKQIQDKPAPAKA
jgi:hypothetical protein